MIIQSIKTVVARDGTDPKSKKLERGREGLKGPSEEEGERARERELGRTHNNKGSISFM